MFTINIQDETSSASDMADLLRKIAGLIDAGNTSGYYPTWSLEGEEEEETPEVDMELYERIKAKPWEKRNRIEKIYSILYTVPNNTYELAAEEQFHLGDTEETVLRVYLHMGDVKVRTLNNSDFEEFTYELEDMGHPSDKKEILNILERKFAIPDKQIILLPMCATCGTIASRAKDGYCQNGHDNWVEMRDIEMARAWHEDQKKARPELSPSSDPGMLYPYVKRLADRMNMTMEDFLNCQFKDA